MRRIVRKTHAGQFKAGSLVVIGERVHHIAATSDRGHLFRATCMGEMHWVGLAVAEAGNRPVCETCFPGGEHG